MRQQLGMNLPFSNTMKVLIGLNLAVWLLGQVILEKYVGIPFSRHICTTRLRSSKMATSRSRSLAHISCSHPALTS